MIEYIPLTKDDASKISNSWGSNSRNFEYLTSVVLDSVELADQYIQSTLSNPENIAYHIKSSSEYVGLVKAKVEGQHALVGYVIDESHWERGYATEAVCYITDQLSKAPSIQQISATCSPNNLGSIRVLEKSGYAQETLLKDWVVYPMQGNMKQDNYLYIWQELKNRCV
jgi:RimJ/RimL family protein N-acetyltransferase